MVSIWQARRETLTRFIADLDKPQAVQAFLGPWERK
jgi:hypothetical protein